MQEMSTGTCVLQFAGGSAHGPNGRFGAWTVTVDTAGTLSIRGQVLGRSVEPGPVVLSAGERQALMSLLDGLSSLPLQRSSRMGIPDETFLHIVAETPSGRITLELWHGDARSSPPVSALLGWIDAAIKAHAGFSPAFV